MPKRMPKFPLLTAVLLCACVLLAACHRQPPAAHGKIVIKYWEKLNGFEADAVRAVVNDFNNSQDRIYVDFTSVSQIDNKFMLATAGGVPPDVAGIWSHMLPVYAENNALMPLDKLAAENNIRRDQYIDVVWQLCCHRQHLWALPTTPSSIVLVWNKKLFREAGLDPEKPPRSIKELEEYNDKIIKYRPDGRIERIGFLPREPDWYDATWGFWFGANMWDGNRKITANSPEMIAAYQWLESYPKRFGTDNLLALREGFGTFASPGNPFLTGRVAMEIQGSWIYSYIKNYAAPDFEWGVAPFPSADPEHLKDVALVESDVLVIPSGAKHPQEAFEFLKYLQTQKVMEKLCLGKLQFSPLKECSAEFFDHHPNPYIKTFLEIAKSPNARFAPRLPTWLEYNGDMRNAVSKIWDGKATAVDALNEVQEHQQKIFDKRMERWDRLSAKLQTEWSEQ